MLNIIQNTIGALARRLGIVTKNLQMWLGFTKADVLGVELVINGDFATDSDWTYDTNYWSISGGRAIFNNTSSKAFYQSKVLLSSKSYKVSFDYEGTGEVGFLGTAGGLNELKAFTSYNQGYNSFVITPTTNTSAFNMWGNWTGAFTISNISVEEVAQFAPDKSTNSNNAKLFTGKALEFNGNDKVALGTTFGLTGEFTVAFWVNLTNYTQAVIVGDSANQDWFRINSATQYTLKINNSSSINIVSGGSIPLSSWSRIALIRDSNNLVTLSINGIIYTNNAPTKSGDFDFTLIGSKSGTFINGLLSNVQIYNKAWVSDDAAFDYANPNNLVFNNSASSISVSNLKGYYALSEGSGSIAYDSATPLGSDEVVNGDFEIASGTAGGFWTAGSGWSISGNGLATRAATGTNYAVDRDSFLTINQIYKVIIEISVVTSGNVTVVLGATNSPSFTSSGTYTFIGVQTSNTKLRISPSSDYVGSVSNISVKEVSAGTITGATYDDKQPTIPQLGMMDWAKSTPDGTNEVTLIEAPNDIGKDVLGNSLRLRDGGFNLDGSGYGSIANDTTLQFGTTAFTIQAWIKPSSLTANNRVITKGVTGNGEWMLSIGTNCIRVYAKDSSGNALDTSSTFSVLTLDVWQMITVVIDTPNNQILFYLNDGSVETKTGGAWTGSFNNTLPITIGNTSSVSSGQFFDGIVDESLIYNSELSAKEIKNNYKIGLSKHS